MIIFFIFILILSIYNMYYIITNITEKKKTTIGLYIAFTVISTALGVYYYMYEYAHSFGYYMLKILKIDY